MFAHPTHLALQLSCKVECVSGMPSSGFFGVFDGHGGAEVAKFVAQALPTSLLSKIRVGRGDAPKAQPVRVPRASTGRIPVRMSGFKPSASPRISSAPTTAGGTPPPRGDAVTVSEWPPRLDTPLNTRVRTALRESFFEVDAKCRDTLRAVEVGTTACCVLLLRDHYAFCNAGDSRAILVSAGRVVFATADHKPNDSRERTRIYRAGGFVVRGRVRGVLAVARAFGDFAFKGSDKLGPEEQVRLHRKYEAV